jgi:hypothetical protein
MEEPMPTEIRYLIELSDIQELRLECLDCHTAIYLTKPTAVKPETSAACRSCNRSWVGERNFVAEFSNNLRNLQDHAQRLGYSLKLQIPKEESPLTLRLVHEGLAEKQD